MRVTVERLRLWILIAAALLVATLAGFFLWSGLKYRRLVQNLPHRLGANIQQTASGFTYSQSSHGHTLFTIHASRLMSFKDEVAQLHDVSITLYGPPGSHRTDKIYGAEFEYNRKTGIASSQGKVEIDLQNPSQQGKVHRKRNIHVQTSQLTYNSKTGLAQTNQYTEFSLPQGSGHATGATYNSKTGMLVLQKQVYLHTQPQDSQAKSGAIIHASHLSFSRDKNQATLLTPTIQTQQQTTTAAHAVLDFRPDGSADHATVQGDVRTTSAAGATFTSQLAQVSLSQKNQPQIVTLSGGVTYASHAPHQAMSGSAQSAHLTFIPTPGKNHGGSILRNAQFNQSVHFVEHMTGVPGDPKAISTRDIHAAQADISFIPVQGGTRSAPGAITLHQNAVATLRTTYTHQPPQQTVVRADKLVATLANGSVLRTVTGTGHAELTSLGKNGATNTTHSHTLHLTFAPATAKSAPAQLVSAVEDGHVVMRQTPANNEHTAQQPVTAWASHADYTAADQIIRLRGNPRLQQAGTLQMSADAIDYHRDTGSALATGNVKATWRQPTANASSSPSMPEFGGTGATHVVAARGRLSATKGNAFFYGTSHQAARLWQGGNSVSAPVIELRRSPQQLHAYGSGTDAVQAAFTAVIAAKKPSGIVRVSSDTLTYSGKTHQGNFHGHVKAVDSLGAMRADNITMHIAPAQAHQPAQLKEMIASGRVTLTQPGRHAAGSKLVYTASNESYVLTGRPGALPYITDRVHGKTTGAALIFNNRNDSVEVNGGEGSAVTETRVPK